MSYTIFSCENTGEVKVLDPTEMSYPVVLSQYCIVNKYDNLYKQALQCLIDEENMPYAVPSYSKKMRLYNGIDRDPLDYTPEDFNEYMEVDAKQYIKLLPEKEETELIFIKINGCDDKVPDGMSLIGYDVAYPFGYGVGDGFSAICDCMFLCRWHGCDEDGTEFIDEFNSLNENGLFKSAKEAYNYLIHYLNQDWSERGDYCIYEIYS